MIWHYFPVGMRFPVPDFSDETKRACWKIALSAAYAADARGTTLYEALEPYDPGSQSAVYTCIVCYVGIKQSRAAGKTMHALDRLLARLCLHNPLVQANYLESYGPYPELGKIDEVGKLIPTEAGVHCFPTGSIEPFKPADGWNLLFVCDEESSSRTLGSAAAENGFRVHRLLSAEGGEGTVCALVSGLNGRYETMSLRNAEDARTTACMIGVIPGKTMVLETESIPDPAASNATSERIRASLDLGYRKLLICAGGMRGVSFEGEPDPRLRACEITVLCTDDAQKCDEPTAGMSSNRMSFVSGAEWILDRIGFSAKARAADFVIMVTRRIKTIETVLSRLRDLERPCCLFTDADVDPKQLYRVYPTLRGIFALAEVDLSSSEASNNAFCADVLPLIGNSVAKASDS